MAKLVGIQDVNNLEYNTFVEIFGNIVECCPETAAEIWAQKPFADVNAMSNAANCYLDQLPANAKERILQLHPDLAGRLADEGKLTDESAKEQKAAKLDKLSSSDKLTMNQLNARYREKYGFPFVICARENKATAILEGLSNRLKNTKDQELEIGLGEVKKICRLRIMALVGNIDKN